MTPKARERRFSRLKEMGCIACWDGGAMNVPAEIHHLNLGGLAGQKRRGDEFTIPLCQWHHQAKPFEHWTVEDSVFFLGPSLKSSRAFRERFGNDDHLLRKVNGLIRQMNELAAGKAPVTEAHVALQQSENT